jgi:hypothetical protein
MSMVWERKGLPSKSTVGVATADLEVICRTRMVRRGPFLKGPYLAIYPWDLNIIILEML